MAGNAVFPRFEAGDGWLIVNVEDIFDAQGNAMQGAAIAACRQLSGSLPSLKAMHLAIDKNPSVHSTV